MASGIRRRTNRSGDHHTPHRRLGQTHPLAHPARYSQAVPPFPVLGWGVECTDVGSTQPKESQGVRRRPTGPDRPRKGHPPCLHFPSFRRTRPTPNQHRPTTRPGPVGADARRRLGRTWPPCWSLAGGTLSEIGRAGAGLTTGAGMVLNAPIVAAAGTARRFGLLAGRRRRGRVLLRRRRLLRVHRLAASQPTHRGHPVHPRRAGVLGGGGRRRRVRLRRRRLLRLHRHPPPQPAHRGHREPPRTAGATGW